MTRAAPASTRRCSRLTRAASFERRQSSRRPAQGCPGAPAVRMQAQEHELAGIAQLPEEVEHERWPGAAEGRLTGGMAVAAVEDVGVTHNPTSASVHVRLLLWVVIVRSKTFEAAIHRGDRALPEPGGITLGVTPQTRTPELKRRRGLQQAFQLTPAHLKASWRLTASMEIR